MTHKNEINRWSQCSNGTRVWYKEKDSEWKLTMYPNWHPDAQYIVDDMYATVRMFFVDNGYIYYRGKKITGVGWYDPAEKYSTTKLEWYEDESNLGKLIMVRNSKTKAWTARLFKGYNQDGACKFMTTGYVGWEYARLVEEDDLASD